MSGNGVGYSTVGGLSELRLLANFYVDPVACLDRFFKAYGRAIEFRGVVRRRGAPRALFLIGPEFNREVLMRDGLRPTGIWPVQAPEGTAQHNLRRLNLMASGPEHARLATPLYQHLSRSRMDGLFDRIRQIAMTEIGTWPVGTTMDIHHHTRRLAQRYALTLLFGEAKLEQVRYLGDLIAQFHKANWSRGAQWPRWDIKGLPYHKVLQLAETLQSELMQWYEAELRCPARDNFRGMFAKIRDAEGCPMTAPRAAAQVAGLMMASYETTASTLAWILFLLTQHPQVMADLTDELSTVSAETVDSETLSKLPLLDGVIKETLRLITPVPVLGFKTIGPHEIAERKLDNNTLIMLSPHLTHRLPDIYDTPDQFRPERWRDIDPGPFEYLPFSGGPRRCPGYWFAMHALKTALAVILPRYRLSMAPGARVDRGYAAVTFPARGIPMRMVPQDRDFRDSPCTGTVFDMFARQERPTVH